MRPSLPAGSATCDGAGRMAPVTEPAQTPTTGIAEIDEALAQVNLDGPVADHHQQLSAAVEALQRALRTPQQ